MSGSIRRRARSVALAMSVGVLGSLAAAPASLALTSAPQPPTVGTNCQLDGRIDGRGSTLAGNLQTLLITGFNNDVCGPVTGQDPDLNTGFTTGAGGNADPNSINGNMIAYNWGDSSTTGSGEGLEAMACRDDEFGGSDFPLTSEINSTLSTTAPTSDSWSYADGDQTNPAGTCELNLASGTSSVTNGVDVGAGKSVPPYPPAPGTGSPAYPNTSDATDKMMTFPIGAGAAAVAYNLSGCTTAPTYAPLDIPASTYDAIMQGQYSNWSQVPVFDPSTGTVDTTPLAGCSNVPVIRAVRHDQSGTTFADMTYLSHIDSSTSLCGQSNTSWTNLSYSSSTGNINDTTWPDNGGAENSTCPDQAVDYVEGTGHNTNGQTDGLYSMVYTVANTDGAIGYGELANWNAVALNAPTAGTVPGLYLANFQTPASSQGGAAPTSTSQFVTPGNGTQANCNTSNSNGLPGGGNTTSAVGLTATNGWEIDQTSPANYSDLNGGFTGVTWPICTFTYDFVYSAQPYKAPSGATGSTETTTGPLQGITYDQLRTLYSYFSYVFSPAAQALEATGFSALPNSFLTPIRTGFQDNF